MKKLAPIFALIFALTAFSETLTGYVFHTLNLEGLEFKLPIRFAKVKIGTDTAITDSIGKYTLNYTLPSSQVQSSSAESSSAQSSSSGEISSSSNIISSSSQAQFSSSSVASSSSDLSPIKHSPKALNQISYYDILGRLRTDPMQGRIITFAKNQEISTTNQNIPSALNITEPTLSIYASGYYASDLPLTQVAETTFLAVNPRSALAQWEYAWSEYEYLQLYDYIKGNHYLNILDTIGIGGDWNKHYLIDSDTSVYFPSFYNDIENADTIKFKWIQRNGYTELVDKSTHLHDSIYFKSYSQFFPPHHPTLKYFAPYMNFELKKISEDAINKQIQCSQSKNYSRLCSVSEFLKIYNSSFEYFYQFNSPSDTLWSLTAESTGPRGFCERDTKWKIEMSLDTLTKTISTKYIYPDTSAQAKKCYEMIHF